MHEFNCSYVYEDGTSKKWRGQWGIINDDPYCFEMLIRGRGSEYQVVLGSCSTGWYLCIPSQYICCSLAALTDRFWNREQISRVLNVTDAVTISSALFSYEMTPTAHRF